jgi:hypothetical protein
MTTTQFFAVATMAATFLPLLMIRRAIKPAAPPPASVPLKAMVRRDEIAPTREVALR